MKTVEARISRLEREIPSPPCSHPGILSFPTDEELAEAERQLADCPRCSTSISNKPHMVAIILEKSPEKALEPHTLEIGSA